MSPASPRIFAIAVLSAVTAFAAAFGIARLARGDAHPAAAPSGSAAAPSVLAQASGVPPAPATEVAGAAPAPRKVRAALGGLTSAGGLGQRLLGRVVDARTGTVLFDAHGNTPAAPASTAKLLTAAAILAVRGPEARFATTVYDAGRGTVVIVGGGDPTLTAAPAGKPPVYAGAARLADLAAAITKSGVTVRRIVVDSSLFPGPSVSPAWDPADVGTSFAGAITALMADGGRPAPSVVARSAHPDLDAGASLARLLGHPGLPVTPGHRPGGAREIGRVESAPLSVLIPQMLLPSDNTIADVLARQVAVAQHVPASFTGAAAAIRTVLGRFGLHVGSGMKDGSGLAAADRLSPATLVALLRLVSGTGPAGAAPLRFIAGALPVGGWSGTLAERFAVGPTARAAGRVRAKTGTLSGVSTLAGFVHDRSGRLLVFDFAADRNVNTTAADAGIDDIVARLARCGCS
jgi:D-alanyl-D-alanine carboxypeptidase/D-alanyl-D-alanine-endopeptidase (penicillin-binding protein 4)